MFDLKPFEKKDMCRVLRYDVKDPLARFDREEMTYDPQRELLQCLCEYDRQYGERKVRHLFMLEVRDA